MQSVLHLDLPNQLFTCKALFFLEAIFLVCYGIISLDRDVKTFKQELQSIWVEMHLQFGECMWLRGWLLDLLSILNPAYLKATFRL